jgi:hypothetical protein
VLIEEGISGVTVVRLAEENDLFLVLLLGFLGPEEPLAD